MSKFQDIKTAPPNPIFDLTARFKADTHPKKINLGVGAYRDEECRPYLFRAVREAEDALAAAHGDHEYLPIIGLASFRAAAARLLFGADSAAIAERRVASVQSISGTGAIRLALDFLYGHGLAKELYIPTPTWGNHAALAKAAGFPPPSTYPYFDASTGGLNFSGVVAAISEMPEGAALLLQACAHNPTGVDPTPSQWDEILTLCQSRNILPIFDSAYQGFASGDVDADAYAIRRAVAMGMEVFVCQSFAKNMGLYSERAGAVHVVTADSSRAAAVESQMALIVRAAYSNPPAHGVRVVSHILNDPARFAAWKAELKEVVDRIHRMRRSLHAGLIAAGVCGTWDHVLNQRGMFTFTGLTREQSQAMVRDHHVYMLANGRVNMAGLTEVSVPWLVDALAAVVGVNPQSALSPESSVELDASMDAAVSSKDTKAVPTASAAPSPLPSAAATPAISAIPVVTAVPVAAEAVA